MCVECLCLILHIFSEKYWIHQSRSRSWSTLSVYLNVAWILVNKWIVLVYTVFPTKIFQTIVTQYPCPPPCWCWNGKIFDSLQYFDYMYLHPIHQGGGSRKNSNYYWVEDSKMFTFRQRSCSQSDKKLLLAPNSSDISGGMTLFSSIILMFWSSSSLLI